MEHPDIHEGGKDGENAYRQEYQAQKSGSQPMGQPQGTCDSRAAGAGGHRPAANNNKQHAEHGLCLHPCNEVKQSRALANALQQGGSKGQRPGLRGGRGQQKSGGAGGHRLPPTQAAPKGKGEAKRSKYTSQMDKQGAIARPLYSMGCAVKVDHVDG